MNKFRTAAVFVNVSDRPQSSAKKLISRNTTKLVNNTRIHANITKDRVANITLHNTTTVQHKRILLNKTANETGKI